jgi:hypothetical protein
VERIKTELIIAVNALIATIFFKKKKEKNTYKNIGLLKNITMPEEKTDQLLNIKTRFTNILSDRK